MARLIAQSAVQPGVSTILGQIAMSAPGAPDFRVIPFLEGSDQAAGVSYQVSLATGGGTRYHCQRQHCFAHMLLPNRLSCWWADTALNDNDGDDERAPSPSSPSRKPGGSWPMPWCAATSPTPTERHTSTPQTARCCAAGTSSLCCRTAARCSLHRGAAPPRGWTWWLCRSSWRRQSRPPPCPRASWWWGGAGR